MHTCAVGEGNSLSPSLSFSPLTHLLGLGPLPSPFTVGCSSCLSSGTYSNHPLVSSAVHFGAWFPFRSSSSALSPSLFLSCPCRCANVCLRSAPVSKSESAVYHKELASPPLFRWPFLSPSSSRPLLSCRLRDAHCQSTCGFRSLQCSFSKASEWEEQRKGWVGVGGATTTP